MFNYLLESARDEPLEAPYLRLCVSAGAIMPATLNRAFEEEVGVSLLDGYGITETSTMVTMNWSRGTRRMGSCGLPIPGSALRIVDPATGADVDPESDGEIWVRGPHVMLGYHNRRDATAEVLEGGWYHTGDLARADKDGFITITGRVTGAHHPGRRERLPGRGGGGARGLRAGARLRRRRPLAPDPGGGAGGLRGSP